MTVKKVLIFFITISLLVYMVQCHNFFSIFAAVATYGRTDDGVWAYKVLNQEEHMVSIRPSDLKKVEDSDVIIPSHIEIQGISHTVTEVADYAYYECLCANCLRKNKMSLSTAWEDANDLYEGEEVEIEIEELVIPSTVIRIGESAFDFVSLSGITFEDNSNLTTIGQWAFSGCTLKSIEIPASVTSIEDSAFSYSSLQTVTFQEGTKLQLIESSAFEESELKSITLPETITRIGEFAFLACNLSKITIPAAVTRIDANAFEENKRLKEVEFAENSMLNRIQMGAFMGCALTEVTIPASVTNIGVCAFGNNKDLETVTFQTTSEISRLNSDAFAKVTGYDYEEDSIEDMDYQKNVSVTQVNVENYDVYKWLANKELFDDSTKIYSKITRVFLEQQEDESAQDNITMDEDMQATVHIDDYVTADTGYHFEESKFQYSDTLDVDNVQTKDIEQTEFTSLGYPYVVIKPNQKANNYEIKYDTNMGETTVENGLCQYDNPVTITSVIPTRTGYEFLGWSETVSGEGVLYQPGEEINKNFTAENGGVISLYAIWKEKTKRITVHFSVPQKQSAEYGFEIVITRNGETVQQHDISSEQVAEKKLTIPGARIGEKYLIKCTNYKKENGQKIYYQTSTKEVIVE